MTVPKTETHDPLGNWTLMGLIKCVNDQRQMLERIQSHFNRLMSTTADGPATAGRIAERLEYLEKNLEFVLVTNKKLLDNVLILRGSVSLLEKENDRLKRQVEADRPSIVFNAPPRASPALSQTTLTILRLLESEGPKSSREISYRIQRSREHTARLMRRLINEGLVVSINECMPARLRVTDTGRSAIVSLHNAAP